MSVVARVNNYTTNVSVLETQHHWPIESKRLAPVIPDPLELETYDRSAWVRALALENPAVTPGSLHLPEGLQR